MALSLPFNLEAFFFVVDLVGLTVLPLVNVTVGTIARLILVSIAGGGAFVLVVFLRHVGVFLSFYL